MHRNGLRVVDLLNTSLLRTHINNACHEKNTIAHALFGTEPLDPKQMYEDYARAAEQIAPFVTDTAVMLNEALDERREGHVRRRAGSPARHRPRHLSLRHQLLRHRRRRRHRHRRRPHHASAPSSASPRPTSPASAKAPSPPRSTTTPPTCSAPAARSTAPSPAVPAAAAGSTSRCSATPT